MKLIFIYLLKRVDESNKNVFLEFDRDNSLLSCDFNLRWNKLFYLDFSFNYYFENFRELELKLIIPRANFSMFKGISRISSANTYKEAHTHSQTKHSAYDFNAV